MGNLTWIFERAGEQLEIRRHQTDTGTRLTISHANQPCSYEFRDTRELIQFQTDMEALLVPHRLVVRRILARRPRRPRIGANGRG